MFSEEMGEIKVISIQLKPRKFCAKIFKASPIPYVLVDKGKAELDRFEQDGVTEKVETTDITAPIVVVPKKYGGIRLCGDY